MLKKYINKIGISILLLAAMLLCSIAVFAVSGAESDVKEYTLTVTIPEDANFGTVELTIGDGKAEVLESGKVYTVTTGVHYKLSAKPLTGYSAEWKNLIQGTGTHLLEGDMNSDIHYEVRFNPKKYDINYVDEHLYSFDVSDTALVPREHTYKSVVSIPNVSRHGYVFDGWILYYSDPAQGDVQGLVCEKDYSASFNAADIWLKPMWKGDEYCVIRLDCWYKANVPYNNGGYLGYQVFAGEMGTLIDGSMGNATEYKGYTYLDDASIFDYLANQKKVSISEAYGDVGIERITEKISEIKSNPDLLGYNVVIRYYLPNQYAIDVDLNAGGDEVTYEGGKTMPTYHVFNENTSIPNPERAGYDFVGWGITVNGIAQPNVYPGHIIVQESVEGDIALKALWSPKKFSIDYVWNGKDDANNEAIALLNNTLLSKYNTYTYGVLSELPYPVRTGYVFDGWIVTQNGETVYEEPLKALPLELFKRLPMSFTLTAQWSPATYTVTLNGNGADDASEPTLSVRFDSALDTAGVQIPKRFGYSFLGYFTDPVSGEKYINADGSSACAVWTLAGDTVLYAHWQELPKVSAPHFLIDYVNEYFYCEDGKIPVGHYEFSYGDRVVDVVVTETSVTVDGNIISAAEKGIQIPNEFIGQTVQLKVFGDGTTTSHNYLSISLNARPKMPTGVSENDDVISINATYTDITVKMKANTLGFVYEFAISDNPNGTGLVWQNSPEFKNLKQGTVYYIYVRAKAVEGAYPHGVEFVSEKIVTLYKSYVDEMKEALDALRQTTDGEMVDRVIKDAKAEMSLLEPSADFHDMLMRIFKDAENEVEFARKQDDKLIALKNILDGMKNSGAYSESSLVTLQNLYNAAQEGIKSATSPDDVNGVFAQAYQSMYAVYVTYLFNGDMELTAHEGLQQSVLLTLMRVDDLGALNTSVRNAIKLGKVTVGGFEMTVEDAIAQLRSKDLFAAYSLQLMNGELVFNDYDGSFTFRLLLPQELRNIEGLRVAFYNDRTGELEVLETTLNGNVLEFKSASIGDFVIMGDPTIDLTNLLFALATILLLQTLAIILLLIRRKKASMELRNYAFAPIMGLTIRIAPDYALTAIVIFGILILLFQIFLIYLLLSSDLVSRHGKRVAPQKEARTEEIPEDEEPIYLDTDRQSVPPAESEHEGEPVLHSLTDSDISDEGSSYGELYDVGEEELAQAETDETEVPQTYDDGAAYANAFVEFDEENDDIYEQEAPAYNEPEYEYDENGQAFIPDEGEADEEAIDGAAYYGVDEDGFIEPAANPNYSLPEEEASEENKEEYYEEDFEEGEAFFDEEPAQGENTGSSFDFDDDEEDLARGAAYYDEPVE